MQMHGALETVAVLPETLRPCPSSSLVNPAEWGIA